MKTIYLDHNSTTPIDPEVLDEMLPYLKDSFGNAASRNHTFGTEAKAAVEKARRQLAGLINCDHKEIVFTSGATESINLALKGFCDKQPGSNLLTMETEHKAVIDCVKIIKNRQHMICYADVNHDGTIKMESFDHHIKNNEIDLVAIMHANNEIGVIHPIKEISNHISSEKTCLLVDGAQSVGKIPVDVSLMGIDLMAISAHKFYGPKGIGALYIDRKSKDKINSQIDGGGHEHGYRSGTLNVPAIVGMGKAAELAKSRMNSDQKHTRFLRDKLLDGLKKNIDGITINGNMEHRLPNNLNVSFSGVDGDSLLINIDDVAVSNGAACSSSEKAPSYVLRSIGIEEKLANASIRFGVGRDNTLDEINYTIKKLKQVVEDLRSIEELKSEMSLS